MRNKAIVLLILFLLYGCEKAQDFPNQSQAYQNEAPLHPVQAEDSKANEIPADFKETSRVINSLYNDRHIIGDDRYLEIKSQLDKFESSGVGSAEIPALRVKLEALRPSSPQVSSGKSPTKLDGLVEEINTIFENKKLVSPEHYARIKADLDLLESQGADKALIKSLREKVESFNIPHPVPLNTTSNYSFRSAPEFPSDAETEQLPDCSGLKFTNFPVDMAKVYEIGPLGAIGPPGHTFPTEHSFIHLHATGTSTEKHDLFAPADVYITHVRENKGATKDPVDYTISFALCKDLIAYYNHVKETSPELNEILKDMDCLDFGQEGVCAKNVFSKVKAGSLLGKVGGHQGNFDVGLMDLSKTNQFANKSRYGLRSLHIQCPYEYYNEVEKQKFFSLIKRDDNERCGTVMQDVPGTIKGNWFYGDARADIGTDWDRHLAFVNVNPDTQIVSIGGTISNPATWKFSPKSSGLENREFSQVTADGSIYCYSSAENSGSIIVKMTSSNQLNIEPQSSGCTGTYSFSKPFTYNR